MMGGEHVAGKDIAIDLGTSTIKIYMEGKGIVLNEPAVVAVDLINDEIIAIGNEAYAMLGRTSERVSVVQPLCHGVVFIVSRLRSAADIDASVDRGGGPLQAIPSSTGSSAVCWSWSPKPAKPAWTSVITTCWISPVTTPC